MDLGFQDIAKREFEFLQSKYGYKCIESGPWLVKYRSKDVFVNIYYEGNRSCELSCCIGFNDDYKDTCSHSLDLGVIVRCREFPQKKTSIFCQVVTQIDLENCTKEYAQLLKSYAHDLLMGSRNAFDFVTEYRTMESKKDQLQRELNELQQKLNIAWKNKCYKKVVELLTPYKENLSTLDMKKLEYAKIMGGY